MEIPEGVKDETGDGEKNILIPAAEGKPVQQKDRGQKTEEENRRADIIAFLIRFYNSPPQARTG